MTRDEAIAITGEVTTRSGTLRCEDWVDALAALGVLKLDEPKPFRQKVRDFANDTRLAQGDAMQRMEAVFVVAEECGLKIVEK